MYGFGAAKGFLQFFFSFYNVCRSSVITPDTVFGLNGGCLCVCCYNLRPARLKSHSSIQHLLPRQDIVKNNELWLKQIKVHSCCITHDNETPPRTSIPAALIREPKQIIKTLPTATDSRIHVDALQYPRLSFSLIGTCLDARRGFIISPAVCMFRRTKACAVHYRPRKL